MERIGGWGCTFSGRKFWPVDPRPEDIDIVDIAHALSNLCRFAGHCKDFYSVGQHSVMVVDLVEKEYLRAQAAGELSDEHPSLKETLLWALLHDSPEAYLVDLPTPLKYSPGMEEYRVIEDRMMEVIITVFGLTPKMPPMIKWADQILIATEARDMMPAHCVAEWRLKAVPMEGRIEAWSPKETKEKFLKKFEELQGM